MTLNTFFEQNPKVAIAFSGGVDSAYLLYAAKTYAREVHVDSLVAPLSVVNALIVAIAAKREKEVQHTFETLEHIWDQYHVYEKRDENP